MRLPYNCRTKGKWSTQARGTQTIPEAIIDSFVILTGGAGIYLAYMSGRQTTRARAVNMYLGLALLLLVVSLLAGTQLFLLK